MSHGHSHGRRAGGHMHADGEECTAGHAHREHAHRHAGEMGGHHGGASVRRLAISLVITFGVMVAEAVGGWISGSLALTSDAAHMLTDAGALGLALVAASLANRPADDRRTYGYRRAEVLGAQINVGALVVLSVWIVWEAVERQHARLTASGALAERRRRQNLRWLWSLVEDQLRQAVRTHPAVRMIRDDLERDVLAGTTPAAAAARRILEAFGIRPGSASS